MIFRSFSCRCAIVRALIEALLVCEDLERIRLAEHQRPESNRQALSSIRRGPQSRARRPPCAALSGSQSSRSILLHFLSEILNEVSRLDDFPSSGFEPDTFNLAVWLTRFSQEFCLILPIRARVSRQHEPQPAVITVLTTTAFRIHHPVPPAPAGARPTAGQHRPNYVFAIFLFQSTPIDHVGRLQHIQTLSIGSA